LITFFNGNTSQADVVSNVWSTGVASQTDGAFGTPGSVSSNSVAATIQTGAATANVSLSASNGSWFRTDGNPLGSNEQLAPFLENDAPLTSLTFSSDTALHDFDMLVHNVWYSADDNQNFIGNFEVTYENGTIVSNAAPILRLISDDSPFDVDFLGGTTQPEGLDDAFDRSNLLTQSSPVFDPQNGAPLGTYLYDDSQSIFSEEQGSGIISFDESIHGGITKVSFNWVGHTVGLNTAFVGFAGKAGDVSSVPEPGSIAFIAFGSALAILRRRRTS
jgi:hypothetical protein